MTDARAWLVAWFSDYTGLGHEEIESKAAGNYLQMEWVDSFQFVMLVVAIEEEFGISFANDEFQDRSFGTVDGLARLIEKRIGGEDA